MINPVETNDAAAKANLKEAPWLILGIPIGCGIGVALGNLALGVGYGILLGATIMVFRVKKEDRSVSPIVKIALVVVHLTIIPVWILLMKK